MGLKVLNSLSILQVETGTKTTDCEMPLYPAREVNTTVVLILGESMKYDDYIEQK